MGNDIVAKWWQNEQKLFPHREHPPLQQMRIGEIIKIDIAMVNQCRAQQAGMIVSTVMATATAYQQQEKKIFKATYVTASNSIGGIGNHAMNAEDNGNCIIFEEFGKQQSTDINRSSNTDDPHLQQHSE